MTSKTFVTILILCLAQGSLSKPTGESNLTEGRGFGSTLWGWLTYPFSWGGSEPELPPVNEQFIASTTGYEPLVNTEVLKHIVTVWCNEQTCTNQNCDKFGCTNMTCNVYDTDFMGVCREYNTIPTLEVHVTKPTEPRPKPSLQDNVAKATKAPETTTVTSASSTPINDSPIEVIEEQPLELEAVLSSTVNAYDKISKVTQKV